MNLEPFDLLPIRDARNTRERDIRLKADVVIVGSGAGGAVMAYELASSGRSVVVLEAGSYVPSTEFDERLASMFGKLYQDKGAQINDEGDILVLQGRCIGGSTVVNGAACFRIPDFVLADWRRDHGLADFTPERMAPCYERVEGRLSVHENTPQEISRNCQVIERGCKALGIAIKPLKRNTKSCANTGFCMQGCASDRKQSMLVTYIPWAIQKGATVFADTAIDRIRVENGRATGVEGDMIDPTTGQKVAHVQVDAPLVVLSAGAIQTPILLQKNRLANSSRQVGKNFALHPSVVALGMFDEDIHGYRGATMGNYCDEYAEPEKGGFILEGGTTGTDSLALISPGIGKDHVRYMQHINQVAAMVGLIHDKNNGSVEWTDEGKKIRYALHDEDKPRVRKCLETAARIYFAAGAREVYLPTYWPTVLKSMEEVSSAVAGLELTAQTVTYYSYHPQGTCRMGVDPARSVVGPTGESHDVKNLFVADASLFPTSILVNPQMTVYALSTLIAEHIKARPA